MKYAVQITNFGNSPIAVIRELRAMMGLGLKESVDLFKSGKIVTVYDDLEMEDAVDVQKTYVASVPRPRLFQSVSRMS